MINKHIVLDLMYYNTHCESISSGIMKNATHLEARFAVYGQVVVILT